MSGEETYEKDDARLILNGTLQFLLIHRGDRSVS